MDASTLHESNEQMIDKVSVVFCLLLGTFCGQEKIPYDLVKNLAIATGIAMNCSPAAIEAVFLFTEQMTEDPDPDKVDEFLSKHQATEEQVVKHLWPDRKVQ